MFKLSKVVKSIKNTPKELEVLANTLDRLRGILSEVALVTQRQQDHASAPPPSSNLLAALESFRVRFKLVEAHVLGFAVSLQRKGLQGRLGALQIPARKETLRKLHMELDRSIDSLQTLLNFNLTNVQ